MAPRTENKIVLITRTTRLDELVARYNTEAQARFYVEHQGADFGEYKAEDERYKSALRLAVSNLQQWGRLQVIDRSFVPNFIFGAHDTVVVLGQDGLVANSLKYLDGQPVIGINPDPARWDGLLLPFVVGDIPFILPELFAGSRKISQVTMARVELNNGQFLHAVNDLFIGAGSHISARYRIRSGTREEDHSSSGIIVSTGLGATGWYKSLITGALAISTALTGKPAGKAAWQPFPRDADYLCYTVREPFPSRISQADMVVGRITDRHPLIVVSQMADSGVIFSDGIESDFLDFNSGTRAVIVPAAKKGRLVV